VLSIAIQHHPSRGHLLGGLASLRAEVVTDPEPDGDPSAVRTYIECLRAIPAGATHRLVLQDDAQPCSDFRERAEAAVAERPGELLALFVPGMGLAGRWMRAAWKDGKRWLELPTSMNWVPVVALVWPVELASSFVPFAEEHVAGRAARRMATMGDDPVVGRFRRVNHLAVWAPVPSLVQHPDLVPSLVKQRSYGGRNPARRAAVFVDD